jgi:ribosomal protein S18 acetylase RimI-like enzyme
MLVRPLVPSNAAAFQALRLRGLKEAPSAFASSEEEEVNTPQDEVAARLRASNDRAVFGAFEGNLLIGIVGVQREALRKLAHKAFIWGMYVAPENRRQGVARELIVHALIYAQQTMHVLQVNLGVNVLNTPAVRLYQDVGFVQYGLERGFLRINGELHDEYQMVCDLSEA